MPSFNLVSGSAMLVLAASLFQQAAAQSATQTQASTSTVISSIILNLVIFAILFSIFPSPVPVSGASMRLEPTSSPRRSRLKPLASVALRLAARLAQDPHHHHPRKERSRRLHVCRVPRDDALDLCSHLVALLDRPHAYLRAGTTGGNTGFNRFTLSQVGKTVQQQKRLAAPLSSSSTSFTFWLMWNGRSRIEVPSSSASFQEFLVSPQHANTAQAKTVLITGIPDELLSEKKLRNIYSQLPACPPRSAQPQPQGAPDLYEQREKWINKLEGAETSLMKTAYKLVKKGKAQDASGSLPDARCLRSTPSR